MSTQESLDSLRAARNKLYEISASELKGWSLKDQQKYGDSLHRFSQDIIKIELADTKTGNEALKKYQGKLMKAANDLERISGDESNLLLMVRSINNGLGALDEIIELIH